MPESRQILVYEERAKPFAGARFVLFGFEFGRKEEILSRLLEGGGLDALNYGPDCTHVIVDKLVYDDPVCVTARRDGKTLVTGLWVDHSLDVGMPVDPTSVIYRPVKDFNGIPGAQHLIVCLTGYQRQDRDDIMTMVGLMGANFLKPLVANKVTHLICYKFEGEKYELAKKIKKIKLVNHRWLEDCLKAWEILSEADYCKSGFELEMEAVAKDSEEETEDITSIVETGRKNAASPKQTLFQNKISYQSPRKPEILGNGLYLTESIYCANVSNISKVLSTPGKEMNFDSGSVLNETDAHHRHLDLLSSCTAKSTGTIPFEMPSNRSEEETVSHKVENVLASASNGAKKSPDADVSKSSSKNHCKITSGKSSLPLRSERMQTSGGSTSVSNVDKLCIGGGFNLSSETHEDGTDFSVTPIKGTMSHLVNEQTATSSDKRKTSSVLGPSKSPRISCISKTLMESEMVQNVTEVLASGTSAKGSMGKGLAGPVSPLTVSGNIFPGKRPGICFSKIILPKAKVAKYGEVTNFAGAEKGTHSKKIASTQSMAAGDIMEEKLIEGKKRALSKTKTTKLEDTRKEAMKNGSNTRQVEKRTVVCNADAVSSAGKTKTRSSKKLKRSADAEKDDETVTDRHQSSSKNDTRAGEKAVPETSKKPLKNSSKADRTNCNLVKGRQNLEVKTEPAWLILSGHKLQRKEFKQVIRQLKGRVCRDSHHWSYQATHFIVPDPIRRTEKFFAAAASGSWILKTDYLTASNEAGRFLSEESFEWHKKGLSEDGAINLEAPRKWRLQREKTGRGAFYGMRIVVYGECIAPPLDTRYCQSRHAPCRYVGSRVSKTRGTLRLS